MHKEHLMTSWHMSTILMASELQRQSVRHNDLLHVHKDAIKLNISWVRHSGRSLCCSPHS